MLRYLPTIVALLGALNVAAAEAIGAERLNVLFIVSDDMNCDLGCYGVEEVATPSLDRLCERAMRFDAAYCQSPLCNPSRVSFLSGLRPDHTGVYTLFTPTRTHLGDAVMLPECFRQNGYRTVQVGKIFHTGDGFEDPQSWDVLIPETGKQPPPEAVLTAGDPPGPVKHTIDWAVLKTADEDTPDGKVARQAAGFMKEAVEQGKPFFLGVGFRRPHAPFAAPKKYFDKYPPESTSPPPSAPPGYAATILPAALNHSWGPRPLTDQETRELRAAYFACNTYVDAQVGVLLQALDDLELWENTVVVFLGDHGYHLGDHGGLWHKSSLFEESCRVPLVIYAPGMKPGGNPCTGLVELIDLYPTLTELCGLKPPENLDGDSLVRLLNDPEQPAKAAAYSLIARNEDRTTNPVEVHFVGRSVRTPGWRYTEWDDGKQGVELYDHQNDPHELHNLAMDKSHADTAAELHALLLRDGRTIAREK
jgi:uncharacterized sulfatase